MGIKYSDIQRAIMEGDLVKGLEIVRCGKNLNQLNIRFSENTIQVQISDMAMNVIFHENSLEMDKNRNLRHTNNSAGKIPPGR